MPVGGEGAQEVLTFGKRKEGKTTENTKPRLIITHLPLCRWFNPLIIANPLLNRVAIVINLLSGSLTFRREKLGILVGLFTIFRKNNPVLSQRRSSSLSFSVFWNMEKLSPNFSVRITPASFVFSEINKTYHCSHFFLDPLRQKSTHFNLPFEHGQKLVITKQYRRRTNDVKLWFITG